MENTSLFKIPMQQQTDRYENKLPELSQVNVVQKAWKIPGSEIITVAVLGEARKGEIP